MDKLVSLTIDGHPVSVPVGTLVVDAAKKAEVYIPVFCYHPKMEPVGMCRMCLVEIGRPVRNRETGEFERDADNSLKVQFGPKLETACTVPVSEGMVVRGFTENVKRARKDILEFLLTSHPLDCPICDKGGECPLQNLTMDFGPGESRFLYDEKKRLAKHYPLGDLILLDRERCIQCGRCVRFQEEIVDDPVLGFAQRGRSMQIVTFSEPGFDSYFSGNTTDICPVGALTTQDFRFGARPWELRSGASICPHCPVGCNLSMNVRREDKAGGKFVIKRVMPRQNEWVNELWICDKGRFAYHFAENEARLTQPLVRKNGSLAPASWGEALEAAAKGIRQSGEGLLTLAGGRLSNEDLFNLRQLSQDLGAKKALYAHMAGGDLVAQVGVGKDTNFSDLGSETAILAVASDLEEEAPIYWLRVKQAAERGAILIVANPRPTKTDRHAKHVLRYDYGAEAALILAMINALSAKRPDLPESVRDYIRDPHVQAAAKAFTEAENAVVLFGSEGTGLVGSKALAQACANLLIVTDHIGRANNGLIGVWEHANTQGAWDMGFHPVDNLEVELKEAKGVYIAAADPAGDDPGLAAALRAAPFLVVQELFLTETAQLADVVLPPQAFSEREGSYTSGERRIQRFYPVVPELPGTRPDYAITAQLGERLGLELQSRSAAQVFEQLATQVGDYTGLSYKQLAEVTEQWPIISRADLYYGGTSYENTQGLGVQLPPASQRGESIALGWMQPQEVSRASSASLLAVPITRLYDRGQTVVPSTVLHPRIPEMHVLLNPGDASRLGVIQMTPVQVALNGAQFDVRALLDETVPQGVALVPRSMGLPISKPSVIEIQAVESMAVYVDGNKDGD